MFMTIVEIGIIILGLGLLGIKFIYNNIVSHGVGAARWVGNTQAYLKTHGVVVEKSNEAMQMANKWLDEQKNKKNNKEKV